MTDILKTAKTAEFWAAEIVRAELADNWALADGLRRNLRVANRERREQGLKPIRATQHWYFERGGQVYHARFQ